MSLINLSMYSCRHYLAKCKHIKKDINLCHLNFCLHLLSVIYLVYLQYIISSRLFLTAVLKVCMYLCCLCVDENLCLSSAHLFSGSADNVLWTETKGTSVVTADYRSASRLE